jgi:hypothetical protein
MGGFGWFPSLRWQCNHFSDCWTIWFSIVVYETLYDFMQVFDSQNWQEEQDSSWFCNQNFTNKQGRECLSNHPELKEKETRRMIHLPRILFLQSRDLQKLWIAISSHPNSQQITCLMKGFFFNGALTHAELKLIRILNIELMTLLIYTLLLVIFFKKIYKKLRLQKFLSSTIKSHNLEGP